jgi:hypothetical protein
MSRQPPCGTPSAYRRHRRRREVTDPACADARAWFRETFLRRRKGTRDQVSAHDQAVRDLWRNSAREKRAGIRHETPEFLRLNHLVNDLRRPLSPVQRSLPATQFRIDVAQDRERRRSR